MTNEEITKEILDNNPEDSIHDEISESIHDFIDEDDIEEHGSAEEAYLELGRGEAESQVLQRLINPYDLSVDDYCEVHDALCDEWCLTTD